MRLGFRQGMMGLLIAAAALRAPAREDIRLATHPTLSPDGRTVLFEWKGDIWSVPVTGGRALQLTSHPASDAMPFFSPDGKEIAFASRRDDVWQVYVMPAGGGRAERITMNSEGAQPAAWFPGGRDLLVRAVRDQAGPDPARLFRVARQPGPAEQLLFDDYGADPDIAADGKRILFCREGVDRYRKGYRGSAESQIWLWDGASNRFSRLPGWPGGIRDPLWHPDGRGCYYTAEWKGAFNLWTMDFASGARRPLTAFTDAPVMQPCLSGDGVTLVFRHLFDLYVFRPGEDTSPRRLEVWNETDTPVDEVRRRWTSKVDGDGDLAWTDDGLQMAFTAGGDLWVMDTVLREPRLVAGGSGEREIEAEFTRDARWLYFLRDDGLGVNICRAARSQPAEYWWQNREFKLQPITNDRFSRSQLTLSPDGQRLAYVRGRGEICIGDLDGGNVRVVAASPFSAEYEWSPDSRWMVCSLKDSSENRDVWIVAADGATPPYNLSRHPFADSSARWSPDGRVIAWAGERTEGDGIFYVWLRQEDEEATRRDRSLEKAIETMSGAAATNSPAARPAETEVRIDWAGLQNRIHKIDSGGNPGQLLWGWDVLTLAFRADRGGRTAFWRVDFPQPGEVTQLCEKVGSGARWLQRGSRIVWELDGVPAHLLAAFPFSVYQRIDVQPYRRLGFRIIWRMLRDNFYDARLNNLDWESVRLRYEDQATAAPDHAAFCRVVDMLLGELNASHMGFSATDESAREWDRHWESGNRWKERTDHLGLIFDPAAAGKGLRVAQVVPGGPADQVRSRILPGETVLRINSQPVQPGRDLAPLLTGQAPRDYTLVVADDRGAEREVVLRGMAYSEARELLQKQRLETSRRRVSELSRNDIGYLSIERMQWAELRQFEQEIFAEGIGKRGMVIDVRDNPGGFISDHLLAILCHPLHALTVPRGGGVSYPAGYLGKMVWNQPIVVLCNQFSCSNTEIFSHAVQSLGRGKLVGVATQGAVISTPSRDILDLGRLALPDRGWFTVPLGRDMELEGARPDVEIWPWPGERAAGLDRQLERAAAVLMEDVSRQAPAGELLLASAERLAREQELQREIDEGRRQAGELRRRLLGRIGCLTGLAPSVSPEDVLQIGRRSGAPSATPSREVPAK